MKFTVWTHLTSFVLHQYPSARQLLPWAIMTKHSVQPFLALFLQGWRLLKAFWHVIELEAQVWLVTFITAEFLLLLRCLGLLGQCGAMPALLIAFFTNVTACCAVVCSTRWTKNQCMTSRHIYFNHQSLLTPITGVASKGNYCFPCVMISQ